MKKLLILMVFFMPFLIKGQTNLSTISLNEVLVYKKTNPLLGVKIGDSKSKALTNLGAPNKTENQYSDFDEVNMEVLIYGNSKLYFVNNKFMYLEIIDFNTSPLTIGTSSMKLTKDSPHFTLASLYNNNNVRNISKTGIQLHLKEGNIIYDKQLLINYDYSEQTFTSPGGGPRGEGVERTEVRATRIKNIYISDN